MYTLHTFLFQRAIHNPGFPKGGSGSPSANDTMAVQKEVSFIEPYHISLYTPAPGIRVTDCLREM